MMKKWILWVSLLHVSVSAAQGSNPISDPEKFASDVGLALSQVQNAETTDGLSHYRMRRYHFFAPESAISELPGRFQMREIDQNNPFDVGIKGLVTIGSQNWLHSSQRPWRIWDLVPPYQHTFIACYPATSASTSKDFAFRFMTVASTPETNGQHEVSFAVGNAVPDAPSSSGCAQTSASSTFRVMFGKVAPFAFAERSFDEMISGTLPSAGLLYHGVFSIDPYHHFRFQLSAAQFQKLLRTKPFLKALGLKRIESGYAERENLGWWLTPAQRAAKTWYGFCEIAGSSFGYVNMTWHEGFVYWYSSGIAAPSHDRESCNLMPVTASKVSLLDEAP